jgi:hypothetical protein
LAILLFLGGGARKVLAQDQAEGIGQCSKLYTDDEARQFGDPARRAVPRGRFTRKAVVLKKLGIDPNRLCNRRHSGANLGQKICWQISPSYDLTWWQSAFDGPPLARDDRRIYSVRIMQRQQGWLGTQCPMTDEDKGVKRGTTRK